MSESPSSVAAHAHPPVEWAAHAGYAPGVPVGPYPQQPPDRLTLWMGRMWARTPRWAAPVGIAACFFGAGVFVMATDPTEASADALPTCVLKLMTGLDCPGCGGTRAFWYVLHGNLPAAARHHALFLFSLPFLLYIYLAWAGRELFSWKLPQLRVGPRALGLFLGAWGVFAIVRNLPWTPFTWLYV